MVEIINMAWVNTDKSNHTTVLANNHTVSTEKSGVTAGAYDTLTEDLKLNINAYGVITKAENVPRVAIDATFAQASGDLEGVYPNLTIRGGSVTPGKLAPSGVVAGTYGGPSKSVLFTIGDDGLVTSASESPVVAAPPSEVGLRGPDTSRLGELVAYDDVSGAVLGSSGIVASSETLDLGNKRLVGVAGVSVNTDAGTDAYIENVSGTGIVNLLSQHEGVRFGSEDTDARMSFKPMSPQDDSATVTVDLGLSSHPWAKIHSTCGVVVDADERAIENITDLESSLGLAFVKSLRPVTSTRKDTYRMAPDGTVETVSHARTHVGFVAQELKSSIEAAGKTLSDVDIVDNDFLAPTGGKDAFGIYYDKLVVPLVKSVQELSADLAAKQSQIDLYISTITAQSAMLAAIEARLAVLEEHDHTASM